MKRIVLFIVLLIGVILIHSPVMAGKTEEFRKIKILDDVMVFVDVEGKALDAVDIQQYAIAAFKKNMRGMEVNNDAVVDNYPAEGYELANVGYIIIKIMDIRTQGGVNAYHVGFEFGIPPREVYWDTATMGIAPTSHDLKKEVYEDVDEVMKEFADAFFKIRGE